MESTTQTSGKRYSVQPARTAESIAKVQRFGSHYYYIDIFHMQRRMPPTPVNSAGRKARHQWWLTKPISRIMLSQRVQTGGWPPVKICPDVRGELPQNSTDLPTVGKKKGNYSVYVRKNVYQPVRCWTFAKKQPTYSCVCSTFHANGTALEIDISESSYQSICHNHCIAGHPSTTAKNNNASLSSNLSNSSVIATSPIPAVHLIGIQWAWS